MEANAQTVPSRRIQHLLWKLGDLNEDFAGIDELIVVYKRTGELFVDFEGPAVMRDEQVAPAMLHQAARKLEAQKSHPGDWLDPYIAEQREQAAVVFADPAVCDYGEADEVADAQA